MGPAGEIIALGRKQRPRGRSSVAEVVADLASLAIDIHPAPLTPDALVGVGVAVAGVVRREDGLVRTAPNLGWRDVALAEPLARALSAQVPVTVANDADLGALAESAAGQRWAPRRHLRPASRHRGWHHRRWAALSGAAGYGGESGRDARQPGRVRRVRSTGAG
jgi:predicted NBD/HSP70 family sugar kinase